GTAAPPSDVMIRREALMQTGGFQEQFIGRVRVFEDTAFLVRVYLRHPVFVSGESWTRYRNHPDSCVATSKSSGDFAQAKLFFLTYLDQYLTQEDVQNAQIWSLLRKALGEFGRSISSDRVVEGDPRQLKWQLRVSRGNQARLILPEDDPELIRVE